MDRLFFEDCLAAECFSKIFENFKKNNTRFKGYKTFEDEYLLNNPKGTDLKWFKDRLNTFFNSCVEEKNQVEKELDPLYQDLCKFDFQHQASYFDKVVDSAKPLIPFVIRGLADYGQRWLYNRLIYQYEQKKRQLHPSISIDLAMDNYTLERLIDQLSEAIKVENYQKASNIAQKKARLKQSIIKKIETSSQIIVLNNAYSFVENYIDSFWQMLKEFYTDFEATDSEHKCVLFFVENEPNAYQCTDYLICSKTYQPYQAKEEADPKFIDLHNIEDVGMEAFTDWFNNHERHDYWKNANIQNYISACNGNPYQILNLICEKQEGTKLLNYEPQWLKY